MYLFIMYDLPTETTLQRKTMATFRKKLLQSSFIMLQQSIYIKPLDDYKTINKYTKNIIKIIPADGHIVLFSLTDKQYIDVEVYENKKIAKKPTINKQLELF